LQAVLVTGCNGGIGSAIVQHFSASGYCVLGIDRQREGVGVVNHYFQLDLSDLVDSKSLQDQLVSNVAALIQQESLDLKAIINNAALQVLGSVSELAIDDFLLTQKVNVAAPLLLTQLFVKELELKSGSVINIGSIHAALTKPEFVSYATSKAALRGLTQAMAVDLQGKVRVNCIEPAAIATDMLVEGFKNHPVKLAELNTCHPSQKIGNPGDVAEICFFLVNSSPMFLNGSCIGMDGAISSRLHDPV
jgi:NAD(P)-dependent dehydrogenase (short-subunit alcohol dehydrogenase family)